MRTGLLHVLPALPSANVKKGLLRSGCTQAVFFLGFPFPSCAQAAVGSLSCPPGGGKSWEELLPPPFHPCSLPSSNPQKNSHRSSPCSWRCRLPSHVSFPSLGCPCLRHSLASHQPVLGCDRGFPAASACLSSPDARPTRVPSSRSPSRRPRASSKSGRTSSSRWRPICQRRMGKRCFTVPFPEGFGTAGLCGCQGPPAANPLLARGAPRGGRGLGGGCCPWKLSPGPDPSPPPLEGTLGPFLG